MKGPSKIEKLDPTQQEALSQLTELCETQNVRWPISNVVGGNPEGQNDDQILLQYLTARKFNVIAAFNQYKASATWRREIKLEETYDNVSVESFELMRRLQPQWTGRRDPNGVPIMVYVVSEVKTQDIVSAGKADPKLSSIFLSAEYVTRFVETLCSELQGTHIATSVNIIDLSHVGISTFWPLRTMLRTASEMATAHYPESVDRIYIVGAPSFLPTIWRFITSWFDPETTRKIEVLSGKDSVRVLTNAVGKQNLPIRFGGDLQWSFNMHPDLDEEAKALSDTLGKTWVQGPLRCFSRDGKVKIVAVGTENGNVRRVDL